MIKLRDILKEIGEGTATPYKFKYIPLKGDSDRHRYRFTTDSKLEYHVDLFNKLDREDRYTILTVMFNVMGGLDYSQITNRGEQYKIMATVINIIKADIELIAKEGYPTVKKVEFTPEKNNDNDTRRASLYKAYIQKQVPNAHVDTVPSGEIRITMPQ